VTRRRTSKPRKGEAATPKAQGPANALKARLYDLSTGELAVRYQEGLPSEEDGPLVGKSPGGVVQYGILAGHVGELIAQAAGDGLFTKPLFTELRSRIAPHRDEQKYELVTVATVAWLRDRGHKIGGGWAQEIRQVADAVAVEYEKAHAGRRRRRWHERKQRPMTAKQAEAVQIVGECKGNLAQAAKRIGIGRKTLKERYDAGMKKLGRADLGTQRRFLQRLKHDRRGQVDLANGEDRRL
jgi:hypothetical protein